jgi:hypothetical protein
LDLLNKYLDNKEETTYGRSKKKSTKDHKRITRYLKNTVKQKDNRVNQETVCGSGPSSIFSSLGEGEVKAFTSR